MEVRAEIGVFGGSGFYSLVGDGPSIDHVDHVPVRTPYGPPSAAVAVGEIDGRRVAFLPRHGVHHELPPHRVNYRANAWALHSLGVRTVIGPCACGSLRDGLHPGELVILDQLVDRTWGRPDTFAEGGVIEHLSFADPYSTELAPILAEAARAEGATVHETGTVVVVNGPRFSTRAESQWFRTMGWDVVNMTQYPEVALCRELGMAYAGLALVTDYDTGGVGGLEERVPVTIEEVFKVLAANVELTRRVLSRAIPLLP